MKHSLPIKESEDAWLKEACIYPTVLSVKRLGLEAKKFLEENFRGLVSLTIEVTEQEYINANLDFTVYALKLLIMKNHARSMIKVNFSCDYSRFVIKVDTGIDLADDQSSTFKIYKVARDAGFSVTHTGSVMTLVAPLLRAHDLSIFTKRAEVSAIMAAFARIFLGKKR